MFIQLSNTTDIQSLALILNTILLIVFVIVVEVGFAEMPKKQRTHLKLIYPLIAVLVGLFIFATYQQGAVS